jgi:hypothetical protein
MLKRNILYSILAALAAVAILAAAPGALAQAEPPSVLYRPVTHINITEGDVIDGNINKPDHVVITSRIATIRKNLIRLREDFRHKIVRSASEL